jgi:phosphoribosylaminoimidazole carboxylase (NCAIR synthetase)
VIDFPSFAPSVPLGGATRGDGRPVVLVVELEGAAEISAAAAALGWRPVFVRTNAYRAWLTGPDAGWRGEVRDVAEPSFLDLFALADAVHARSVLPVSLLEPECARDALLRDHADQEGGRLRVVANRPAAVEITYDKWLTKCALEDAGFPRIPGRAVSSVDELRDAVAELGLPVVCKPRRAYTGRGIRALTTTDEVEQFVRRHAVTNLLVEPFVGGSELSLEVVRGNGGWVAQPIVYKGESRLNVAEHPAYRPRVAPWRPGTAEAEAVTRLGVAIATELRLHGAAEFEFLFANGVPHLMEINPRVSGVTRLAMQAGGGDTFGALMRLAAGLAPEDAPPAARRPGAAMQLPITVPVTDPAVAAAMAHGWIAYAKPITWMPQLPLRGSLLVRADGMRELAARIDALAPLTSAAYLAEAHATLACARGPVTAASVPRLTIGGRRRVARPVRSVP